MKFWRRTTEQISGFLDRGANLAGELQFSGTLRIDGNFRGTISSADTLVVGENAVVHADISVGSIEIHGHVFGNVEVRQKAEIASHGVLRGSLTTTSLALASGGILDGKCCMVLDTSAAPAALPRESTRLVADSRKAAESHFRIDRNSFLE